MYQAVAVNSEGLLAVTDGENMCVHLLSKDGALVRSIGKGVLDANMFGVAFDLKGNVWVTDWVSNKVVKLSQDGQLLQTICYAGSKSVNFRSPCGMSVSPEGLIYICYYGDHRVTVQDEESTFLFAFGSKGSGPGHFDKPRDVTFGSDGLVYVTDYVNRRVSVWSKEGTCKRDFRTKCKPACIAATDDNHLLITSYSSNTVMVYTLGGELVHEFGGSDSHTGKLDRPWGICINSDNGLVYVADRGNNCVLIF